MLESGAVSIKNEVNIMMKNVVDIVLGGTNHQHHHADDALKILPNFRLNILDVWI